VSGLLKFTDAASLALHGAAFLAGRDGGPASTGDIAAALGVSQAHLSKILQRLTKAGTLTALRGPGGGYELARPAEKISLKEVYEAIERPLDDSSCPFGIPACGGGSCVLGSEFVRKERELSEHLAGTPLSSLRLVFENKPGAGRKRSRAPKRTKRVKARAPARRRKTARKKGSKRR